MGAMSVCRCGDLPRGASSRGVWRRGFALIELLVVVAIIALMLSILVPSLRRVRLSAMQLSCANNLRQINLGVHMYLDAYDNTYPCAQDPISTSPFYWLWMGRGWRGFIGPHLGGTVDANDPSVLLCPQDRESPQLYESTSYAYSMAFYHSRQQIDDMNDVTDTFTNPQAPIPQKCSAVAYPAQKILIGEWFSNHFPLEEDKGWWIWQGERNFLLADGHVRYLKAAEIRPANDGFPNANLTRNGIEGWDVKP